MIVKKYYIYIDSEGELAKGLKRYSFVIPSCNKGLVLIHYSGDTTLTNNDPHIRTCPSVLKELESSVKSPSVVYKDCISKSISSVEHHSVLLPRNKKQVSNMQAKGRQKLRLSHDALYNVHELAFDLDNFFHKIITFPDLIIVCGLKVMLTKINKIIQLHHSPPILFSYDTTFQLGNFYLSPFLFKNPIFQNCPVMPVLFLIHERKFRCSHEELMKVLASEIPSLVHGKLKFPIVTDDEKAFRSTINQYLPQCVQFFCWNHVINSAKLWLRRHGASTAEVPVYVCHLRDLFHNKSENEYLENLEVLKQEWSEAFVNYYDKEIHNKVHFNDTDFIFIAFNL